MIELKLIPDGAAEIPMEARDHGILWELIRSNSTQEQRDAFVNNTPAESIRDIQRVVPGHREHVGIRVPGEPADYPDGVLDAVEQFFTNNISGLKPHPSGWQYVAPPGKR